MTVPSGIYSLKANVAGTVTLNLDGLPHIAEASVSSTSPVQFVCKAKTLDLYAGAGSCEDYLSTKPGMCGCWYGWAGGVLCQRSITTRGHLAQPTPSAQWTHRR